MKPFFSYYGSKFITARHLGKPRRDLVIEPFAGSACYSTRWNCRRVKLFDISPDICDLWDFLIHSSVADVAKIPSHFEHIDEVMALPRGPNLLVRFMTSRTRCEPTKTLSPWYFKYREDGSCRVWSSASKSRIIKQKPLIADWTIDQCHWSQVPIEEAHWHVDPPYSGKPGRKYPHNKIDYLALADWCMALPGAVDVCENYGADWLPFESLCEIQSASRSISHEAVWRKLGFAQH